MLTPKFYLDVHLVDQSWTFIIHFPDAEQTNSNVFTEKARRQTHLFQFTIFSLSTSCLTFQLNYVNLHSFISRKERCRFVYLFRLLLFAQDLYRDEVMKECVGLFCNEYFNFLYISQLQAYFIAVFINQTS